LRLRIDRKTVQATAHLITSLGQLIDQPPGISLHACSQITLKHGNRGARQNKRDHDLNKQRNAQRQKDGQQQTTT